MLIRSILWAETLPRLEPKIADEQSNAKADVALTRKIRRAVTKDHALSMAAHNVKIISVNGVVTSRGPVNNEQEKAAIGSKGEAKVVGQLIEPFVIGPGIDG